MYFIANVLNYKIRNFYYISYFKMQLSDKMNRINPLCYIKIKYYIFTLDFSTKLGKHFNTIVQDSVNKIRTKISF